MVNANDLLTRLKAGNAPAAPKAPKVAEPVNPTPLAAPWASSECPNCGGTGWNEDGSPCAICIGTTMFDMTTVTLAGPFEFTLAEKPQEAAPVSAQKLEETMKRAGNPPAVSAAELLAKLNGNAGPENAQAAPPPSHHDAPGEELGDVH